MTVNDFRIVLDRLQHICNASGAKSAAKDLKVFSNALEPHSRKLVDATCAELKGLLSRPPAKTSRQRKASPRGNNVSGAEEKIKQYVNQLRESGADRPAFDTAFVALRNDKSIKTPDVAEIARQYSLSVTKYKSAAAAHSDIEKAFVRQARFENKLR